MTSPDLVSVVIPVYRDGARACAAANAMLLQSLPDGVQREVVVVDDGSDDDTAMQLSACRDPRIRVLRLPCNQGRSAARNVGVAIAAGEFVVFMDCDCVPDAGYLAAHLAALSAGAVTSAGHVTGTGGGFWDRYQHEASSRRQHQHASGMPYAGSSQNLAVRRSEFEAVGGFDTGYRRYGFEDRDLLLRIAKHGRVAWAEGAIVHHQDAITLTQVTAKMMEAGEHSSQHFATRHPNAYRQLGYAALDARLRPALMPLASCSVPVASLLAAGFDSIRGGHWLPYSLAKWIVKVTSALAYLGGTARAR